jgi:hypothetical protein
MLYFLYVYIFLGVLYIESDFNPSFLINTTFRNVSDPSSYTDGGVLYMNSLSYDNFTIDRCIFTLCTGYYGGAIFLDTLSPSIIINRCRFLDNTAVYGHDIYVSSSSCFNPNTIINSCSASRIFNIKCDMLDYFKITEPCYKDIVLFIIFFFFE